MTDPQLCGAKTRNGTRCRNRPLKGLEQCRQHFDRRIRRY